MGQGQAAMTAAAMAGQQQAGSKNQMAQMGMQMAGSGMFSGGGGVPGSPAPTGTYVKGGQSHAPKGQ